MHFLLVNLAEVAVFHGISVLFSIPFDFFLFNLSDNSVSRNDHFFPGIHIIRDYCAKFISLKILF